MNENQKAQQYDRYMYEYDQLSNQVSSIKGENFELNDSQRQRIYEIENKMRFIMESASKL
jgi:hypothetical protein